MECWVNAEKSIAAKLHYSNSPTAIEIYWLRTLCHGPCARRPRRGAAADQSPPDRFSKCYVPSAIAARVEAFRRGLRELGYVEGKNIVIEWRYAEGKLDRLTELAAELVRLKVDVIVSAGPPPTRSAKKATLTIPIVMALIAIPWETDLSPALRGLGETLLDCQRFTRS